MIERQRKERRELVAMLAMHALMTRREFGASETAVMSVNMADALCAELDRTEREKMHSVSGENNGDRA